MKKIVLASALAFAIMPLTFAAQNPPAKTAAQADTGKSADKTSKKGKDTSKKSNKKGSTGSTSTVKPAASTPAPAASTPVKK
jgi:hypothetical protein